VALPVDYAKLRSTEWDYTMSGGSPLAHICPVCCAHVPFGNDANGRSYRMRHADWHEANKDLVPTY